jgi:hypothetical protein
LTVADYDALLLKQGGGCYICGATTSFGGVRLAVDHDHETGKVRGILCKACNVALGQFRDNPEFCDKAAEYLRTPR